jgi:secondary thiamine-phosphate synthase enzyme
MVLHTIVTLPEYRRGFHLVTNEIIKQIPQLPQNGVLHLFIQHTSAAITLNENADPSVRRDFESFFRRAVPDGADYFTHTLEGDDDMTAHIKSSIIGQSVSIPIINSKLALGTWQGIYLCEFRDYGGKRRIIATCLGE